MSYGLVAWCVGSVAACAAAGLGTSVLIREPTMGEPMAVAAIRTSPDFTDPTREMPVPEVPLGLVGLGPDDVVPSMVVVTASLFGDPAPGMTLRPAFMDAVAEYRPEEVQAPAAEPQAMVREILSQEVRSRDLSRAMIRPPPRPTFTNRAPAETDRQADEAGIGPAAKGPSSVFGLLSGSIFGRFDDAASTYGHSAKPLQSGMASWYGPGFNGRRTASGERFNQNELTAAHRSLPFGTMVKVVDPATGRSVIVRINDRGPYGHGRVIDLSRASAEALGLKGLAKVQIVSAE